MKPTKQEYQEARYLTIQMKQLLFLGFLSIGCFIGLLWFFRPTKSDLENRELTKFPKLTLAGLWDGSFFSSDFENGSEDAEKDAKKDDDNLKENPIFRM